MMNDIVAVLAAAALALAGWAVKEVARVETIADDLKYLRGRVDAIYDHFLGAGSGADKG